MLPGAGFGFAGSSPGTRVAWLRRGAFEPARRRDPRAREAHARARACCRVGARRSRHSGRDGSATDLKAFFSDLPEEAFSVF
jgi:hypothetical protein